MAHAPSQRLPVAPCVEEHPPCVEKHPSSGKRHDEERPTPAQPRSVAIRCRSVAAVNSDGDEDGDNDSDDDGSGTSVPVGAARRTTLHKRQRSEDDLGKAACDEGSPVRIPEVIAEAIPDSVAATVVVPLSSLLENVRQQKEALEDRDATAAFNEMGMRASTSWEEAGIPRPCESEAGTSEKDHVD